MPSEPDNPRLLIAAGGTGGHIYPGLAVAREFAARHPDAAIVFVGTSRGLEEKIAGSAGFDVRTLRAEPLRGGSIGRRIKGVLALIPSFVDAIGLLREVRPDVVLGVGGYVSGPILLAASRRGIPTLVLEPNVDPGLTNKWLARFVDAAAVAWPDTARHFRGKAFVSGNPIRAEIAAVPDVREDGEFRVLLFGGSQGSRVLNDAMIAAIPSLGPGVSITHQTGPGDLDRVRAAYAAANRDDRVEPYLPSIDEEYARCHIVVSRAGATTCAELAAAGRGAILVPLELAGGHQRHNADALAESRAAEVIHEEDLTGDHLAWLLNDLSHDPPRYVEMGRQARQSARPEATKTITDKLEALITR